MIEPWFFPSCILLVGLLICSWEHYCQEQTIHNSLNGYIICKCPFLRYQETTPTVCKWPFFSQHTSMETFYHSKCLELNIRRNSSVPWTNFQSWKYHEFDSISWVYPTEPRMQAKVWLDLCGNKKRNLTKWMSSWSLEILEGGWYNQILLEGCN